MPQEKVGSEGVCFDGEYQAIEDDSKDLGDQGKEEKNMDKGSHAEEEVFVEGELSAEGLVNAEERKR